VYLSERTDVPSLDGVKVPDSPAVAEGVYHTLKRVQVRLCCHIGRVGLAGMWCGWQN
jgi:hypothetical protein